MALIELQLVNTEGEKVCRLLHDCIPNKGDVLTANLKDGTGTRLLETKYYTVIATNGERVTVYKGKRV